MWLDLGSIFLLIKYIHCTISNKTAENQTEMPEHHYPYMCEQRFAFCTALTEYTTCTIGPHFVATSELRPPQNKDHFPAVPGCLYKSGNFHCTHTQEVNTVVPLLVVTLNRGHPL